MVKFRKIQLDSPTSGLSAAGEFITAAGGLAGAPPESDRSLTKITPTFWWRSHRHFEYLLAHPELDII